MPASRIGDGVQLFSAPWCSLSTTDMKPLLSAYSHISSIASCIEACSSGDEPGLAMVKRIIDINMRCTLVLTRRQKPGGLFVDDGDRESVVPLATHHLNRRRGDARFGRNEIEHLAH